MKRNQQYAIVTDVDIGEGSDIYDHVNLYGCEIGKNTKIDAFVYIEEDVVVGDGCTIRPFVFIPTGVEIGDEVFIGPGVTFTNDRYPGVSEDWELERTVVKENVSIGAGATVLPGLTIESGAVVGAGAVVIDDVPENSIVVGNPGRILEDQKP